MQRTVAKKGKLSFLPFLQAQGGLTHVRQAWRCRGKSRARGRSARSRSRRGSRAPRRMRRAAAAAAGAARRRRRRRAAARARSAPEAVSAPAVAVDNRSDDYYQVKTTIF